MTLSSNSARAPGLIEELLPLVGRQIRVTVIDEVFRERVFRTSGVLESLNDSSLAIFVTELVPMANSARVAVEGVVGLGSIWFHSTLIRREGQSIALTYPSFVHHAERRLQGRIDVELKVRLDVPGAESVTGMVRDISRGGAALRMPTAAAPGQVVSVALPLDSGSSECMIPAEIVRCSGPVQGEYAVGIRFSPEAPGLMKLEEWIIERTYWAGL